MGSFSEFGIGNPKWTPMLNGTGTCLEVDVTTEPIPERIKKHGNRCISGREVWWYTGNPRFGDYPEIGISRYSVSEQLFLDWETRHKGPSCSVVDADPYRIRGNRCKTLSAINCYASEVWTRTL